MDAVEKAARALFEGWVLFRNPSVPRLGLPPSAYQLTYDEYKQLARAVLAAVGYPAHQSSDEGTCWCPVAEQAGRERDALRAERDEWKRKAEAWHDEAWQRMNEAQAARAALGNAPEPRRRLRECVERWPDAQEGGYDPRCCRFPKSCSAEVYDDDAVSEGDLEPRAALDAKDCTCSTRTVTDDGRLVHADDCPQT